MGARKPGARLKEKGSPSREDFTTSMASTSNSATSEGQPTRARKSDMSGAISVAKVVWRSKPVLRLSVLPVTW